MRTILGIILLLVGAYFVLHAGVFMFGGAVGLGVLFIGIGSVAILFAMWAFDLTEILRSAVDVVLHLIQWWN